MLRERTSGDNRPDTLAPKDNNTDDMVFKVDPITHLRLDRTPHNAPNHVAQLSALTDSILDHHAPEVLLMYAPCVTVPLMLEQGLDLVSGVVTTDEASFTTLLLYRVKLL